MYELKQQEFNVNLPIIAVQSLQSVLDDPFFKDSPAVDLVKTLFEKRESINLYCTKIGSHYFDLINQKVSHDKMMKAFHFFVSLESQYETWISNLGLDDCNESYQVYNFFHTKLIQNLIKYRTKCLFPDKDEVNTRKELTEIEAQSIRYVAGYICFSIKKNISKKSAEGRAIHEFFECLGSKQYDEIEETWQFYDFLDYTRAWVDQINRGGLHEISDDFFLLIKKMELVVRDVLRVDFLIYYAGEDIRKELFFKIKHDHEVNRIWNLLIRRLESETLGLKIFNKIIHKWINIRAHHFVKALIQIVKLKDRKSTNTDTKVSDTAEPSFRRKLHSKKKQTDQESSKNGK